jgi:hypothetical protein
MKINLIFLVSCVISNPAIFADYDHSKLQVAGVIASNKGTSVVIIKNIQTKKTWIVKKGETIKLKKGLRYSVAKVERNNVIIKNKKKQIKIKYGITSSQYSSAPIKDYSEKQKQITIPEQYEDEYSEDSDEYIDPELVDEIKNLIDEMNDYAKNYKKINIDLEKSDYSDEEQDKDPKGYYSKKKSASKKSG